MTKQRSTKVQNNEAAVLIIANLCFGRLHQMGNQQRSGLSIRFFQGRILHVCFTLTPFSISTKYSCSSCHFIVTCKLKYQKNHICARYMYSTTSYHTKIAVDRSSLCMLSLLSSFQSSSNPIETALELNTGRVPPDTEGHQSSQRAHVVDQADDSDTTQCTGQA